MTNMTKSCILFHCGAKKPRDLLHGQKACGYSRSKKAGFAKPGADGNDRAASSRTRILDGSGATWVV